MTDLAEQLAIVAESARAEWQGAVMYACLFALGGVCIWALARFVSRNLRRVKTPLWPLAAAALVYGGTKPDSDHLWAFLFTNGLTDNGSTCEGNEIRAKWTATALVIDGNYTVRMQYRDASITNAAGTVTDAWHAGENALASALQHTWTVAGATNMQVVVWAEYVSPVVVHTNGVYRLGGAMREMGGTQKYVTPGIQYKIHVESGEIEVITPTNRPPAGSALLTTTTQEDE